MSSTNGLISPAALCGVSTNSPTKPTGVRDTAERYAWLKYRNKRRGDTDTNQLNTQKVWEAPRGHPRPAEQAGRLYAIHERGAPLFAHHDAFIDFFNVFAFFSGSLLSSRV